MKRADIDRVSAANQSLLGMTTEIIDLVASPTALVTLRSQPLTNTERCRDGQLDRTQAIPLQQLQD